MPEDAVQFGILGAGRIAARAFAPALQSATNADLAAVASRDLDRAKALGGRRAYDSYEALLDDPEVEAVYIATHNGLHHPLTIRAVERGKHVLCEKPLACDASQCSEMVAAARAHSRHLMEGFMYRYHPQIAEARAMLDAGAIGDLRVIEASFSFLHTDETDVRCNPAWGGGSLMDVGCYCVNACRYFLGGMPGTVKAYATFHPLHGVDTSVHGVLDFGQGRYGVISCGFDGGLRNRLLLCGTQGTITLPSAFANRLQATTLELRTPRESRDVPFEPADVFRLEIEDFARAVRGGPPPMLEPEEGLRNARVIEALFASARQEGMPKRAAPASP